MCAVSIPGLEKFPGEGNGNPLQYSCLENPMDRGAWWAIIYGVAKSQTRLGNSNNNNMLGNLSQIMALARNTVTNSRVIPSEDLATCARSGRWGPSQGPL